MSRDQLKYLVPGYVWQQRRFSIDWESARQIIKDQRGIVVVESQSQSRREYAAASFLSLILRFDYHAEVGWLSYFPRPVSEFTDAYQFPKLKKFQAIAVKVDSLTPSQEDQIQDLAVSCDVAVIAVGLGFNLHTPHVRISLSAREDVKNFQEESTNRKL